MSLIKYLIITMQKAFFFHYPLTLLTLIIFVVNSISFNGSTENVNGCNNRWPSLDIFIPINTKSINKRSTTEFEDYFLLSFLIFWPRSSQVKINAILDSEHMETTTAKHYVNLLNSLTDRVDVKISLNDPTPYYNGKGYDRQQLIKFWSDNFTTSEFVGFVDTETIFLTYVTVEDIFEDGDKPVVNGRTGNFNKHKDQSQYIRVANFTYELLGILEPMRCMSYFPIVVRTSHLKKLREYLEKRHGMPFNMIFKEKMQPYAYMEFNIMCAFLFEYYRDDYRWYIHNVSPEWDGKDPPPVRGQLSNFSLFTPQMWLPKPRISIHAKWKNLWYDPATTIPIGICYSPPYPKKHYSCSHIANYSESFFKLMHIFEDIDFTKYQNNSDVLKMHAQRRERISHCSHKYDTALIDKYLIYDRDFIVYAPDTRKIYLYKDQRLYLMRDMNMIYSLRNDFNISQIKKAPRELFDHIRANYYSGLYLPRVELSEMDVLSSSCSGRAIYLLRNGTLHEFNSFKTFVNLNYDTNQIKQVSCDQFNSYNITSSVEITLDINDFPVLNEMDVLSTPCTGRAIYLLQNGTLHEFNSFNSFINMKYDSSQIRKITCAQFSTYNVTEPIY